MGSVPRLEVAPTFARRWLLRAAGLDRAWPDGQPATVLAALGCIQLDPIDRVGPNAELVAFARLPGLRRGELFPALAGRAFEHFAKERCLIHARFFPHYREQVVETGWWRRSERATRVDEGLLADVRAEIAERGPLPTDGLTDRGRTEPLDWSGWKSTSSRAAMAASVLWLRCDLVVAARDARGRHLYDLPERALGPVATAAPDGPFAERMVVERVRSAGLLARAGGPTWSMLAAQRTDGTVDRLLDAGALVEVRVAGQSRPYLALPEIRSFAADPVRVDPVVLGPLDPLLWDRALVQAAFGFDYTWEVYKPAAKRTWGYYVCPVLRDDGLVGRVEARRVGERLVLEGDWAEPGGGLDPSGLDRALSRLAAQNRCVGWARP